MVAQGDLGDAPLLERVVEGATPHFGAQGAGVALLAQVEDDVVDFGVQQGVGHIQPGAQVRHPGEVGALPAVGVAHVQSNGLHREGLGIELPQLGQGRQQRQGILSPGDPNGHPVPGLNHVVILHTAADVAQNLVHGAPQKRKMIFRKSKISRDNRRKNEIAFSK